MLFRSICDVEQDYGNEAEEALFAWNGYLELTAAWEGYGSRYGRDEEVQH